jgi:hypothetical protein
MGNQDRRIIVSHSAISDSRLGYYNPQESGDDCKRARLRMTIIHLCTYVSVRSSIKGSTVVSVCSCCPPHRLSIQIVVLSFELRLRRPVFPASCRLPMTLDEVVIELGPKETDRDRVDENAQRG